MPFNSLTGMNLMAGTSKSAKIDSQVHHLVNSMVAITEADIVVAVMVEDTDSGGVMDEVDMVDLAGVDMAVVEDTVMVAMEEEEEVVVVVVVVGAMLPSLLTTLPILHPLVGNLLV